MAIIWERNEGASEPSVESIPYGLQVSDLHTLVENAAEKQILLHVMEGIVQDKRVSQIAGELNSNGY